MFFPLLVFLFGLTAAASVLLVMLSGVGIVWVIWILILTQRRVDS